MVSAFSLWLPILLSAVLVFVVSSVLHMVLKYHANDVKGVPRGDEVQAALRPFNIPPGDYAIPYAGSMENMKTQAFQDKLAKGPVLFMTVRPNGAFEMGGTLFQWFLYSVVISFVTAYVTGLAHGPGTPYPQIFRVAGTVGFACYALGTPQFSIWYGRSWRTTFVSMLDGFIYGCVMAGTFGWLWPK